MQNISFIAVCVLLFCTAMQARAAQFIEHSKKVENECSQTLKGTPVTQWLETDASKGQSLMTEAALCYQSRIRLVARDTKFQHAGLVNNFAETLVKISRARDEGKINAWAALSLYRNLSYEFRTFISIEDAEDQQRESLRIVQGINGVMSRLQT
jgi:hypothetical protein